MRAHCHRPALLGWCLLILQACCSSAELTVPTTVEIDLVFPRNDTYAPSPIFPVVVAVQNAPAASLLDTWVNWYIDRVIPPSNSTTSPGSKMHQIPSTLFGSDPYLVFQGLYGYLNSPGTWRLDWEVATSICDTPIETVNRLNATGGRPMRDWGGTVFFTIQNGAQKPDIAAPAAQGTCSDTQGVIYNVTGPRPVNLTYCAVDSSDGLPAADPCRIKLDPSTASSISDSLTATACALRNPVISCPSRPLNTAGSEAQKLAVGGMGLLNLAAACLVVWCVFA